MEEDGSDNEGAFHWLKVQKNKALHSITIDDKVRVHSVCKVQ